MIISLKIYWLLKMILRFLKKFTATFLSLSDLPSVIVLCILNIDLLHNQFSKVSIVKHFYITAFSDIGSNVSLEC